MLPSRSTLLSPSNSSASMISRFRFSTIMQLSTTLRQMPSPDHHGWVEGGVGQVGLLVGSVNRHWTHLRPLQLISRRQHNGLRVVYPIPYLVIGCPTWSLGSQTARPARNNDLVSGTQ